MDPMQFLQSDWAKKPTFTLNGTVLCSATQYAAAFLPRALHVDLGTKNPRRQTKDAGRRNLLTTIGFFAIVRLEDVAKWLKASAYGADRTRKGREGSNPSIYSECASRLQERELSSRFLCVLLAAVSALRCSKRHKLDISRRS